MSIENAEIEDMMAGIIRDHEMRYHPFQKCAEVPGDPSTRCSVVVALEQREEIACLKAGIATLNMTAEKLSEEVRRTWARFHEQREELAKANGKLDAVRMLKWWTNEDGKGFVFTEDLCHATDPEANP